MTNLHDVGFILVVMNCPLKCVSENDVVLAENNHIEVICMVCFRNLKDI